MRDSRRSFKGRSFATPSARGARPQRVLWASTSTKDPHYRDTLYVEELIGPETVDTIPPATLAAFEDHGVVRGDTVTQGIAQSLEQLVHVAAVGVNLAQITEDLQTEGVGLFADSYALLLRTLASKKEATSRGKPRPRILEPR